MRKTSGFERVKVNTRWITLHSEKLRSLYSSPNRISVTKSRKKQGVTFQQTVILLSSVKTTSNIT